MTQAAEIIPQIGSEEWREYMLSHVEFLVQCTHYESHTFWCQYHDCLKWEQISLGFNETVGYVTSKRKKLPVCVDYHFARLNGHLVMFYDSPSRCCDWDLIEQWIKDNVKLPPWEMGRYPHCDSWNFHNCVGGLKIQLNGVPKL